MNGHVGQGNFCRPLANVGRVNSHGIAPHVSSAATASQANWDCCFFPSFYFRAFCFWGRLDPRFDWVATADAPTFGPAARFRVPPLGGEDGAAAAMPAFSTLESAVPSGEPRPLAASHPGPAS